MTSENHATALRTPSSEAEKISCLRRDRKRVPSILPQVGVMSNTLINVSNRLPVTVEGDKIAKSAADWSLRSMAFPKSSIRPNGLAGLVPRLRKLHGSGRSSAF